MVTTGQRSFDDLGTPLYDVTFCVLDLETTGASPTECGITEIGAVKLQGGECLGTFQTLVDPGCAIPPPVTVVTGITEAMVLPAPPIEAVLPTLLEFIGGTVIVGHNIRFDLAFLAAALDRAGYGRLANTSIDTCKLARRLVRDEVPDCRLGTLASRFGLAHRPTHRALSDALATADLLHVLLERAGSLGVTGLDDLLTMPTIDGHPQAGKLRLTNGLPRAPGVYLFRDRAGTVLYVGKAANLRTRVRSYFSSDQRRKVPALLRETASIDHQVCTSPLEAAVHEVRLIHRLRPRFNRQARNWDRYAYVKLTLDEAFPRLSVVRDPRDDGGLYLGPLPSGALARRAVEAVETVVPLRRCTKRIGPRTPVREAPCTPAQLGVATCPCARTITATAYATHVHRAARGLTVDPDLLLVPLRARMEGLAAQQRFEEAADVRDRAAALSAGLRRQRRIDGLRQAGRLVVHLGGAGSFREESAEQFGGAEVHDGRLVAAWGPGDPLRLPIIEAPVGTGEATTNSNPAQPALPLAFTGPALPIDRLPPCPREQADEVLCVARWLDAEAHRVRIVHCDGGLSSPLPALPTFEPARSGSGP
jgi:DNA polymerase-3 subunit epsilon